MKSTSGLATANAKRYVALDGLRGLLAITVVIHHYAQLYHVNWMGKAWISVDAFFILSGFVITHSYAAKIQSGMHFSDFAKSRLLRLYPMYLVGLALGLTGLLFAIQDTNVSRLDLSFSTLAGLLILPYFNHLAWPIAGAVHTGTIFPMNDPAWSLFFELFVNFLFFAWIVQVKRWSGKLLLGTAFVLYLWAAQIFGIHSGWGTDNFMGGIPRVILYFSLGCVIYSIHLKVSKQALYRAAFLAVILIAGFSLKNTAATYFLLLVVSPLAILVASRTEITDSPFIAATLTRLGRLSYPLYITHFPLAIFSYWVLNATGISTGMTVFISTLFALAVSIPLSVIEPRLRGRLTALFNPAKARSVA